MDIIIFLAALPFALATACLLLALAYAGLIRAIVAIVNAIEFLFAEWTRVGAVCVMVIATLGYKFHSDLPLGESAQEFTALLCIFAGIGAFYVLANAFDT
jgi:apolipoprotein N-acyltransferase